jgi:hypothetical protein
LAYKNFSNRRQFPPSTERSEKSISRLLDKDYFFNPSMARISDPL